MRLRLGRWTDVGCRLRCDLSPRHTGAGRYPCDRGYGLRPSPGEEGHKIKRLAGRISCRVGMDGGRAHRAGAISSPTGLPLSLMQGLLVQEYL